MPKYRMQYIAVRFLGILFGKEEIQSGINKRQNRAREEKQEKK